MKSDDSLSGRQETYTEDAFLGGRLRIQQPSSGFRSGLDSVVLAAAVPATSGELVLELGLGVGVAALCLGARVSGVRIYGVEIDPAVTALAMHNADRNSLTTCLNPVVADITRQDSSLDSLGDNLFDHAFANPPFYVKGRVCEPGNMMKRRSYLRKDGDLDLWVRLMIRKLRSGGTLTLILPTCALDEVLAALNRRAGSIIIFPLFPRFGVEARRVIVQAVKGSKGVLRLMPGLVLHSWGGEPSPELEAVLRKGEALALSGC